MEKKNLFFDNYEHKLPFAYRFRPIKIEDYVGQEKIIGENGTLRKILKSGRAVNSIFYGPPGTGKTSLAEILSYELSAYFEKMNATTATVSDIKEIVIKAEKRLTTEGRQTILFLDEIHRFNKLQQDSLLPHTENGRIVLIGATTENPYYALNNSLMSRCIGFEFNNLDKNDIKRVVENCIKKIEVKFATGIAEAIAATATGDARRALNIVEILYLSGEYENLERAEKIIGENKKSYDKSNDKYEIISAFIKSIRGSDPDAALYWLARMIEGGEDPLYIARRLIISAAEDIGIANPDALIVAVAAMNGVKEIGMPESRIILSEATVYLAISTKSNSTYSAINSAIEDIKKGNIQEVPDYLKNSNEDYKYPHSYEGNFVFQKYMLNYKKYYEPGNNKNEDMIKVRQSKLWGCRE
jgi:putative ATPase